MKRVSSSGVVSYKAGLLTFHCLFIVLYAKSVEGGREGTNWRALGALGEKGLIEKQ